MEAIFENIIDGVVVVGEDMDVVEINKPALDIFGLDSKDKPIDSTIFKYISSEDEDKVKEAVNEIINIDKQKIF